MKGQDRQPRIDRKHRFALRITENDHNRIDVLSFRHNVSQNVTYCEAVRWALASDAFHAHMKDKFPRDTRRGHFTYTYDYREGDN
jgi:hypothetical protein